MHWGTGESRLLISKTLNNPGRVLERGGQGQKIFFEFENLVNWERHLSPLLKPS
jgi:hypothetical protein